MTEEYDLSEVLTEEERRVEFAVDSPERLEWYVRKQAAIQDEIARVKAQAAAIVRDLERQAQGLEFRFGSQAEVTLRRLLADGKRKNAKSHKTFFGTIGLRTTPASLKVVREDAVIEALRALPEVADAAVVTRVDAAALKRLVKVQDGLLVVADTGEVVDLPGVQITEPEEKVYIKTAKAEE